MSIDKNNYPEETELDTYPSLTLAQTLTVNRLTRQQGHAGTGTAEQYMAQGSMRHLEVLIIVLTFLFSELIKKYPQRTLRLICQKKVYKMQQLNVYHMKTPGLNHLKSM